VKKQWTRTTRKNKRREELARIFLAFAIFFSKLKRNFYHVELLKGKATNVDATSCWSCSWLEINPLPPLINFF